MRQALIVFAKELNDALRDRRTLLRILLPALLMGPLLLTALSGLIASFEAQAEKREVVVEGRDNGPTLVNFIERQTYTLVGMKGATNREGYEALLRDGKATAPMLVIPKDFEAQLLRGEAPVVEVVSDSANQRASAGVGMIKGLLYAFNHERASLNLAMRGVSVDLLEPIDIQERDLASAQARATRLTSILPMFIIMAVLYGALTAALDSTAGERERGSLEPLLMNPVPHGALVAGKWGAVALLGMAVALLSSLSFVPAQWLLKSDVLQAQFSFGLPEVLAFWLLQVPLAAGLSGLLMALAIRSKSFKEAQAGSALVVTAVSLAPMVSVLNPGGEAPWYLWVPGLAQNTLMLQVLKGEALRWSQVVPGVVVGFALAAVTLAYVARSMRAAVAR
ncbi:ABC transporter permease [Roseateles cellulosilyticus]|uniref:ABC transporter permease subunit n=1 Tax=Pelomonas cellulosilytica TaxID=2906762 RepID=A0ABS8XSN3_9BURK|nr:ABC transporter permease [Pelomonas sp. P8]MCE4555724.1 ABC transporter permease subunit [Pelomonas sp. P8]